jgi:hypothetical protein
MTISIIKTEKNNSGNSAEHKISPENESLSPYLDSLSPVSDKFSPEGNEDLSRKYNTSRYMETPKSFFIISW